MALIGMYKSLAGQRSSLPASKSYQNSLSLLYDIPIIASRLPAVVDKAVEVEDGQIKKIFRTSAILRESALDV